jgi:hypothetical protein
VAIAPSKPKRKPHKTEPDWSKRYAENWPSISRETRRLTKGRCCLCLKKATCVHHCRYRDRQGAIAGREKPGRDVVPLCGRCHKIAHSKENWIRVKGDRLIGHHNTSKFAAKLRKGFFFWWIVLNYWGWILAAIALFFVTL